MYTASITTASLRMRESRVIAKLLLQGVDAKAWREAIKEQNVLQMKSVKAASSIAQLIRARLEPMGSGVWEMVRDADGELATQAVFAAAVGNSRLLGDFLDLVIRDHLAVFNRILDPNVWADYIAACQDRDPDATNLPAQLFSNILILILVLSPGLDNFTPLSYGSRKIEGISWWNF